MIISISEEIIIVGFVLIVLGVLAKFTWKLIITIGVLALLFGLLNSIFLWIK
jgi:hypothetical protein